MTHAGDLKSESANVPRETRRYVSAFRRHQGEDKKRRLVQAAIELIEAGTFRPTVRAIVDRVGCAPCNLIHHFGSLEGLLAHLAAEHAAAVAKAAGLFFVVDPEHQSYVVRLILLGRRADEAPRHPWHGELL